MSRVNGPRYVEHAATPDERLTGLFLHLGFLSTFFALPVLVTLVLWFVKRGESAFVDDHGREAVNMQITMLIYLLVVGVLGFLTCGVGWVLATVLPVLGIIFCVLAATAANRGEYYRYPAVIRLV